MDGRAEVLTFIVRVVAAGANPLTGVVERVRTREKAHFDGVADIGRIIAGMVAAEARPKHARGNAN